MDFIALWLFVNLILLIACLALLVRLRHIANIRLNELRKVKEKANKAILSNEDWECFYDDFHKRGNITEMLYDFRKWAHGDFYPGI